jgi:hypothetical protein
MVLQQNTMSTCFILKIIEKHKKILIWNKKNWEIAKFVSKKFWNAK